MLRPMYPLSPIHREGVVRPARRGDPARPNVVGAAGQRVREPAQRTVHGRDELQCAIGTASRHRARRLFEPGEDHYLLRLPHQPPISACAI